MGELRDDWLKRNALAIYLQPAQIPFHGGVEPGADLYDGFGVVPMKENATTPPSIRRCIEHGQTQLRKMKLAAPNPPAQRKFEAADRFLELVRHRWDFVTPWD
jgi:hypothetical protein